MSVVIKTPEQIDALRIAGRYAAELLEFIKPHVEPGISTEQLDDILHDYMVNTQKVVPACLGYHGYPKSNCISVNQVVCHGIPSAKKILKKGDIVNVDVTVIKNGWHGDTSAMFLVGEVSPLAQKLVRVTRECMLKGIAVVKPGATLGDIGHVIQQHAEANHFSVVREYCGHGIGQGFHEDPQVLHYGKPGIGLRLEEGMVFTIEPMINAGQAGVRLLPDGWTVVTRDHKLSAQWEHMMAVTKDGVEVLTKRRDETDLP